MMGKRHALSGLVAGLGSAPALGIHDVWVGIPFAMLTAGAALLPDLDHPKSSASLLLHGFTGAVSSILRRMSAALYQRTKGPRDENWSGKHRHLTHTLVFALVAGGIVAGLCAITPWAAIPFVVFTLLLAADRLGDWVLWAGLGSVLLAVPQVIHHPQLIGWQVGAAITIGCLTHDVGDALTKDGCPILWLPWPLTVLTTWRGESWYEIHLLGRYSFRTDGPVENKLVGPVLLVLMVVAAWQFVAPTVVPIITGLHA